MSKPKLRAKPSSSGVFHTTKLNFEIFKASAVIAAVIGHLPPKGQQTVSYYGLYSKR